MKSVMFLKLVLAALLPTLACQAHAGNDAQAWELLYDEQEAGTDVYRNRYLVSETYIRIEDPNDDGGYILFDKQLSTIYSVSHADESVLVIKSEAYERPDMEDSIKVDYRALADAPTVAGKQVYNYHVVSAADDKDTCMDVHLVEGLLPDVTTMLNAYQKVIASQQARVLDTTPEEFRTACFLYDQVYNEGVYYEKGLPIQEWHSNRKKKSLVSYRMVDVHPDLFSVPGAYRQYSLD